MPKHIVQQGEHLGSIAEQNGVENDDRIWNHGERAPALWDAVEQEHGC